MKNSWFNSHITHTGLQIRAFFARRLWLTTDIIQWNGIFRTIAWSHLIDATCLMAYGQRPCRLPGRSRNGIFVQFSWSIKLENFKLWNQFCEFAIAWNCPVRLKQKWNLLVALMVCVRIQSKDRLWVEWCTEVLRSESVNEFELTQSKHATPLRSKKKETYFVQIPPFFFALLFLHSTLYHIFIHFHFELKKVREKNVFLSNKVLMEYIMQKRLWLDAIVCLTDRNRSIRMCISFSFWSFLSFSWSERCCFVVVVVVAVFLISFNDVWLHKKEIAFVSFFGMRNGINLYQLTYARQRCTPMEWSNAIKRNALRMRAHVNGDGHRKIVNCHFWAASCSRMLD